MRALTLRGSLTSAEQRKEWGLGAFGSAESLGLPRVGRAALEDPAALIAVRKLNHDHLLMGLKRVFERYNEWQQGMNKVGEAGLEGPGRAAWRRGDAGGVLLVCILASCCCSREPSALAPCVSAANPCALCGAQMCLCAACWGLGAHRGAWTRSGSSR